jgi:hypothetical protein
MKPVWLAQKNLWDEEPWSGAYSEDFRHIPESDFTLLDGKDLDLTKYKDYFIFTTIRNTYDRIISLFYFLI